MTWGYSDTNTLTVSKAQESGLRGLTQVAPVAKLLEDAWRISRAENERGNETADQARSVDQPQSVDAPMRLVPHHE